MSNQAQGVLMLIAFIALALSALAPLLLSIRSGGGLSYQVRRIIEDTQKARTNRKVK